MNSAIPKYLRALFGELDEGYVELRLIDKQRGNRQEFFLVTELDRVAERIWHHRDWGDVFIGVAARTREAGTKDAISRVHAVWVDIDWDEPSVDFEPFPLRPSISVLSGGKLHLHHYFLLDEPTDPPTAEALNRGLARRFGGDPACVDVSRVLRPPATVNRKYRRAVKLNDCDARRRYSVAELAEALGECYEEPVSSRMSGIGAPGMREAGTTSPVDRVVERLDQVADAGPRAWMALCPAHDDHRPSLSVAEGGDGRCLLHCFAGCTFEDVVAAVGLDVGDLFADTPTPRRTSSKLLAKVGGAGLELFHTPARAPHASIVVDGHRETWPLVSEQFELWLRRLHYEDSGEALAGDVLAEAIATLAAKAQFDGDEREVYRRVAAVEDGIVIDMGDSAWRAIEVTAEGWRIVSCPDLDFVRDSSTLPLPEPVRGGSIDELRSFVNCADERSWYAMVGILLMALNPWGPYPIGYLTGEQGSAKSTGSRIIASLVDPRKAPLVMGAPSIKDLAAIANNVRLVGFDNVSTISRILSDALCQLVTGAGYRARELYSNASPFVLDLKRPVILNGIGQVATRPDLLDRVALVELEPIPREQRRTEHELWAAWDEARPRILGALLDGVVSALAHGSAVKLDGYPRLADFARWGEAAGINFGWTRGAFAASLERGRDDLLEGSADAHPEIRALLELMEKRNHETWTGSAGQLLGLLTNIADDHITGSQTWPRRPDVLSNRLVEHAPLLRSRGIEIHRGREAGGNRNRFIRITSEGDAGTRGDA